MSTLTYNIFSKNEHSIGDNLKIVNIIFTVNVEEKEVKVKGYPVYFQITYYFNETTNQIQMVNYVGEQSGEWELYINQLEGKEGKLIGDIMFKVCIKIPKEEIAQALHS